MNKAYRNPIQSIRLINIPQQDYKGEKYFKHLKRSTKKILRKRRGWKYEGGGKGGGKVNDKTRGV